jgi:membrane peptidoglycan carboxypeptidase
MIETRRSVTAGFQATTPATTAIKVPSMAYRLRSSQAASMLNLQRRLAAIRQQFEPIERAHPNVFLAAAIVSFTFALVAMGASAWLVYDVFHDLPSSSELRGVGSMAQATTLYDRDNKSAFAIFQERRIEMPLSDISPNLVHAIIAIEDQRFYDHRGIDLIRIFAAAATNLRAHRAAQGGSTLTQQLARQSFLTPDKTLLRKLKKRCWRGVWSASSARTSSSSSI